MMIIPERLHKLRIMRGLSQPQLAKKSRISVRQLQRLEKSSEPGKSVRETTLNNLARDLGVKTEVLTGESPLPDGPNKVSQRETERVQIGALIQAESRLAYDLVKIRYGIKATEIINMAPLFFVLLAEVACPRISEHLVKRIPLVSHTPSDSHIPASNAGVWDCKTAQYN